MKKLIYVFGLTALTVFAASCDKDEDNNESQNCEQCELLGAKIDVCKINDKKANVKVSFLGQVQSDSIVDIPEGKSFEEFQKEYCGGDINLGL